MITLLLSLGAKWKSGALKWKKSVVFARIKKHPLILFAREHLGSLKRWRGLSVRGKKS